MKSLVTWLKVKRAAVCDITLIAKVQNKVNFSKVGCTFGMWDFSGWGLTQLNPPLSQFCIVTRDKKTYDRIEKRTITATEK